MRMSICLLVAGLLAASDVLGGEDGPPRLLSVDLAPAPWNVQSGGIAAFDVSLDEKGNISRTDIVQDVAPYGGMLRDALPSWLFEPAVSGGRAVPSRVLVLGFFRPPVLNFAAPEAPRYRNTIAPDEIPWPTSVTAPAYPPNVIVGSGKVVMAADISDRGVVLTIRVVGPASPFDPSAANALRQWKFRPVTRGNRPVASRAFIVFSFAPPA
jgi:hypothetical protein